MSIPVPVSNKVNKGTYTVMQNDQSKGYRFTCKSCDSANVIGTNLLVDC